MRPKARALTPPRARMIDMEWQQLACSIADLALPMVTPEDDPGGRWGVSVIERTVLRPDLDGEIEATVGLFDEVLVALANVPRRSRRPELSRQACRHRIVGEIKRPLVVGLPRPPALRSEATGVASGHPARGSRAPCPRRSKS